MFLEQVNSPEDLKKLSVQELIILAAEIRTFLIESLSVTGGHLASNLGIVEITLAMHYLFDSPKDKFLWDVGHQAYVHKLITGRREEFSSLRQYKGLCGFPKMRESIHDVWETGHSSTSLSGAMGMAIARDIKNQDFQVIPVIGDGALTGGMALEALNHIGQQKTNMIIVLNDNEMSISPNVGALHNHLGRLRINKGYNKVKHEIENLLKKIPTIGKTFVKTLDRIKDSIKFLVMSGVFFEILGFKYLGPVNGHKLEEVIECLEQAKSIGGPVLVHIVTKKGQGYKPAENDSVNYHGVGTYKIQSGNFDKKAAEAPTYPAIFGKTMINLAKKDERIVIVTPAMLTGSKLEEFNREFPSRCFDVGIAEQHAVTFAAGLATQGLKPVVSIYSTFLQRGYDQLIHDVCRQNLNVLFAIDRAGFVGEDGETHQGLYDISFMRNQPNIVIMMPRNENEFQHMLHTAIEYNEGPIAVRYSKDYGTGIALDEKLSHISIGEAEMLKDGKDAVIFALGNMVNLALEAAEKSAASVGVINARFVKPLDEKMLKNILDKNIPILTIEEGTIYGGLGSAVLEFASKFCDKAPKIKVMGVPDYYVEHGSIQEQLEEVNLTVEGISAEIEKLLSKNIQD